MWPYLQPLWYQFMRLACRLTAILFLGIRVSGRGNVPMTGGALIVCNHQSFLDPMLVGLGIDRQLHYMARDTLFHNAVLSVLMRSCNGFPVKRGEADLGAVRETMRRVKDGAAVVIFAEGTRTTDGSVGPLMPGFALLARKCGVPVIPAAMDGAYQAWPRTAKLPGAGVVRITYGPPLSPEEISRSTPTELADRIGATIRALHAELAARRLGTAGPLARA